MELKKAAFYGLLIVGVGLCIGGVFVPALFPAGIACISGAVAVARNLSEQSRPQPQPEPLQNRESNPAQISDPRSLSDDSLEVDLHIGHHRYKARLRQPLPEPNAGPDIENDSDAKAGPRKRIHRHRP